MHNNYYNRIALRRFDYWNDWMMSLNEYSSDHDQHWGGVLVCIYQVDLAEARIY